MKYVLMFLLFFSIGCAHQEAHYASEKEERHGEDAERAKQNGDTFGQIENLHKARQHEKEKNDAEIKERYKWGPFYYFGWVLEKTIFHDEVSFKKEY